jgi:hypothetical protein
MICGASHEKTPDKGHPLPRKPQPAVNAAGHRHSGDQDVPHDRLVDTVFEGKVRLGIEHLQPSFGQDLSRVVALGHERVPRDAEGTAWTEQLAPHRRCLGE